MSAGPRFLDDDGQPNVQAEAMGAESSSSQTASPAEALPRGPMLLDAMPDAPRHLEIDWEPGIVATARSSGGAVLWISCGIGVLIVTWAGLALTRFMMACAAERNRKPA